MANIYVNKAWVDQAAFEADTTKSADAVWGTTAFSNLTDAVNAASATEATTITVASGAYDDSINFLPSEIGQKGDIAFVAADGADVVFSGTMSIGYRKQNVSNEVWDAAISFDGITFDHAEAATHSLIVNDNKGITLTNCKIIGDGEYGIGSNGGNASAPGIITNCTFENAGMQVLGNFGSGMEITGCTFDESCVNIQGGNLVTIEGCIFNNTVTDDNVGDSFYCIRSNDTAVVIGGSTFNIDSTVTGVAADQAKWGVLWQRNAGNTQWVANDIEVNYTDAALAQGELLFNKNGTTTAANETDRITINGVTSTSNDVDAIIAKSEGALNVVNDGTYSIYDDGVLVNSATAATVYVNSTYTAGADLGEGKVFGFNAFADFASAMAAARDNDLVSRIEIESDITTNSNVDTDNYYDIAQKLTIGAASGGKFTVSAGSLAILVMGDGASLTIEDGVTVENLDVVADGFATSNEEMIINGEMKALSLKVWTNNNGITVNETGKVFLGYGDGQLDLAYGNGYLTVNGTLENTKEESLTDGPQFKAGYSGTRGTGNTINLNDTYFEGGAWFKVEGSNGTFNLDNSVMKIGGGDSAGSLTVSSSGNVFNVNNGSRLVVANLTLEANNTISVADSSLEVATKLTNDGEVKVSGSSKLNIGTFTGVMDVSDATLMDGTSIGGTGGYETPDYVAFNGESVVIEGDVTVMPRIEATADLDVAEGATLTGSWILLCETETVLTVDSTAAIDCTDLWSSVAAPSYAQIDGTVDASHNVWLHNADINGTVNVGNQLLVYSNDAFNVNGELNINGTGSPVGWLIGHTSLNTGYYEGPVTANVNGGIVNITGTSVGQEIFIASNGILNIGTNDEGTKGAVNVNGYINNTGELNIDGGSLYSNYQIVNNGDMFFKDAEVTVTYASAADKKGSITNNGTITISADSVLDVGRMSGTGTITIDATGFTGTKKVIDLNQTTSLEGKVTILGDGVTAIYGADGDVTITDLTTDVIHVGAVNAAGDKSANTSAEAAAAIDGYNKFDTITDAAAKGRLVDGVTVNYGNTERVYTANGMGYVPSTNTSVSAVGTVTITGGNGAYVPYIEAASRGTVVKFSNANLTLTKLRDNGSSGVAGAKFVIENSKLDGGNTVDNLTWVTFYNDSEMQITNSVIGQADEGDYPIGNIAVGNAAASDITVDAEGNKQYLAWGDYGKFALKAGGIFTAEDSTIFAGYIFETCDNGSITLENSVLYGSRINVNTADGKAAQMVFDGSVVRQSGWGNGTEFYGITIGNGTTGTAKMTLTNGATLDWNKAYDDNKVIDVYNNSRRESIVINADGILEVTDNAELSVTSIRNTGSLNVDSAKINANTIVHNGKEATFNDVDMVVTNFENESATWAIISGASKVQISNLYGNYALRLADGTTLKGGSSIDGTVSVRSLGDLTIGETADDVVFINSYDNSGIEWSKGQTLTVNGTLNVAADGKEYPTYWFGINGGKFGTDGVTTLTGAGTVNVNTTAIFQNGTVIIDEDMTVNITDVKNAHLRFTESDVTIKGSVDKKGYNDTHTILTNATVTVTGEKGSLTTTDDLHIGYDTYDWGIKNKYASTLNVNDDAKVAVDGNVYINLENSVNVADAALSATGTVTNYGDITLSGAASMGAGSIVNKNTVTLDNFTGVMSGMVKEEGKNAEGNIKVLGDSTIADTVDASLVSVGSWDEFADGVADGDKLTIAEAGKVSVANAYVQPGGELDIDGELNVTGGYNGVDGIFANYGKVNVDGKLNITTDASCGENLIGNLELDNSEISLTVAEGGELNINTTEGQSKNTLNVVNGAKLDVDGTFNADANTVINNTGVIEVGGEFTSEGTVNLGAYLIFDGLTAGDARELTVALMPAGATEGLIRTVTVAAGETGVKFYTNDLADGTYSLTIVDGTDVLVTETTVTNGTIDVADGKISLNGVSVGNGSFNVTGASSVSVANLNGTLNIADAQLTESNINKGSVIFEGDNTYSGDFNASYAFVGDWEGESFDGSVDFGTDSNVSVGGQMIIGYDSLVAGANSVTFGDADGEATDKVFYSADVSVRRDSVLTIANTTGNNKINTMNVMGKVILDNAKLSGEVQIGYKNDDMGVEAEVIVQNGAEYTIGGSSNSIVVIGKSSGGKLTVNDATVTVSRCGYGSSYTDLPQDKLVIGYNGAAGVVTVENNANFNALYSVLVNEGSSITVDDSNFSVGVTLYNYGSVTISGNSTVKANVAGDITVTDGTVFSADTALTVDGMINASGTVTATWNTVSGSLTADTIVLTGVELPTDADIVVYSGKADIKTLVINGSTCADNSIVINNELYDVEITDSAIVLSTSDSDYTPISGAITSVTQTAGTYTFTVAADITGGSGAEDYTYSYTVTDSTGKEFNAVANGLEFTLTDVPAAGKLNVSMTVTDAYGETTKYTTDAFAADVADYTAPKIEVTTTASGKDILVSWIATDETGVAGYEIECNGKVYNLKFPVTGEAVGFDFTDLDEGKYSITVSAYDKAGNRVSSETSTINLQVGAKLLDNGVSQIVAWDAGRGAAGYIATDVDGSAKWVSVGYGMADIWDIVATGKFAGSTVDNDGLLLYNKVNNTFAAWTDLSNATHGYKSLCWVESDFSTKCTANLDGDGFDDVLIYNTEGSFGAVLGAATYKDIWHVSDAPPTVELIGAGTFGHEDGLDSLVVKNLTDGSYEMWHNSNINGKTWGWGKVTITPAVEGWEVAAIGDFSGDGIDDIAMWNSNDGEVVLLENGKNDEQTVIGTLNDSKWEISAVGDYNGDGKEDLLLRELTSGYGGLYFANGGDLSSITSLGSSIATDVKDNKFAIIA